MLLGIQRCAGFQKRREVQIVNERSFEASGQKRRGAWMFASGDRGCLLGDETW